MAAAAASFSLTSPHHPMHLDDPEVAADVEIDVAQMDDTPAQLHYLHQSVHTLSNRCVNQAKKLTQLIQVHNTLATNYNGLEGAHNAVATDFIALRAAHNALAHDFSTHIANHFNPLAVQVANNANACIQNENTHHLHHTLSTVTHATATIVISDHTQRLENLERTNRLLGFAIKAVLAVGAIWAIYSCLNPFGSSSPQKTEL